MLFFASKISCFFQNIFHHRLAVNKILRISPEPIQIRSRETNDLIYVPMPSSHFKTSPINCRLLSNKKRLGMVGETSQNEMSKYLIIHVHGGVSSKLNLYFVLNLIIYIYRVFLRTHQTHVS